MKAQELIFKAKILYFGGASSGHLGRGGQRCFPASLGPAGRRTEKSPPPLPGGHLHAPEGASEPPWGLRGLPPAPEINGRIKVRSLGEPSSPFRRRCSHTHLGSFSRLRRWRRAARAPRPGKGAGMGDLGQRAWGITVYIMRCIHHPCL